MITFQHCKAKFKLLFSDATHDSSDICLFALNLFNLVGLGTGAMPSNWVTGKSTQSGALITGLGFFERNWSYWEPSQGKWIFNCSPPSFLAQESMKPVDNIDMTLSEITSCKWKTVNQVSRRKLTPNKSIPVTPLHPTFASNTVENNWTHHPPFWFEESAGHRIQMSLLKNERRCFKFCLFVLFEIETQLKQEKTGQTVTSKQTVLKQNLSKPLHCTNEVTQHQNTK